MKQFDIPSLFGEPASRQLPLPKRPGAGTVKVEIEQEAAEPEAEGEETDQESVKDDIGFTDATQRCGNCQYHEGSACSLYDIQCGPEDGCRVGFEPRSEEQGDYAGMEQESAEGEGDAVVA